MNEPMRGSVDLRYCTVDERTNERKCRTVLLDR